MDHAGKYVDRYAESQAKQLAQRLLGRSTGISTSWHRIRWVIVVPCYDEPERCLAQVLSNLSDTELAATLIIAVLNAPQNAPALAIEKTRHHLQCLSHQLKEPQQLLEGVQYGCWYPDTTHQPQRRTHMLLVDRCSNRQLRLPDKQGVGLARKLGADLALVCLQGNANAAPWIYTTDADAQLPSDYLRHTQLTAAALCLPFTHQSDNPDLLRYVRLYEAHMANYVRGLASAHSPYAHHSLGSAIVIQADHYAQVRGFPKRNAGEDFHILNKLAKTGAIRSPTGAPIALQARYSNRVPFGTGPALTKVQHAAGQITTHPPQAFQLLGQVMLGFTRLSNNETPGWSAQCAQLLTQLDPNGQIANLLASSALPSTRRKALDHWFDALKTLRFVRLASRGFPPRVLSNPD